MRLLTRVICPPARLVYETETHRPSQVAQRKQAPHCAQWIRRAIGGREWRVNGLSEHPPPPRDGHCPVICRAQPHTVLFNDGNDASPTWYLLHWIDTLNQRPSLSCCLCADAWRRPLTWPTPQCRCAPGRLPGHGIYN